MSRTRIASLFLGSLTLLVGGAALAQTPGEAGGQTYGGATYDKTGQPAQEQPAPDQTQKEMDVDIEKKDINVTTPAVTTPVVTEPAPAPTEPRTTVTAPVVMVDHDDDDARLMTPFGLSLAVGGGVTGFTDDSMDDITNTGGAWDARLTIGSRLPIAIEAAYIGTAQEISALGLDPDATLVSNGVEGALRLNLGNYYVQPFVFAGAGWQRFDLVGEDFNTSSVRSRDDIFQLPVGGGIAGKYRGFLLDARVTYRETWDNDLMTVPTASNHDSSPELNQWSGTARVGFEF